MKKNNDSTTAKHQNYCKLDPNESKLFLEVELN
jgi:hypothetical protein